MYIYIYTVQQGLITGPRKEICLLLDYFRNVARATRGPPNISFYGRSGLRFYPDLLPSSNAEVNVACNFTSKPKPNVVQFRIMCYITKMSCYVLK